MDIKKIMKKHNIGEAKVLPQAESNEAYMAQFHASVNAIIEEFRAKHGNTKKAKIEVILDKDNGGVIVRATNY